MQACESQPLALLLKHSRQAGPLLASSCETLMSLVLAGKSLRHDIQLQLAEFGLNDIKLATLLVLDEASKGRHLPTPASLAEEVQVSRSSMTEILDAMETRAWVRRRRAVLDRRQIEIQLCEAGRAAMHEGLVRVFSCAEFVARHMDLPSRRQFNLTCSELMRNGHALNAGKPA